MPKKVDFEKIRNAFESEGYYLLESEETYKNNDQKLEFICPVGHYSTVRWRNWITGSRCSLCRSARHYSYKPTHNEKYKASLELTLDKKRRARLAEIREKMSEEGYVLLSNSYKNNKTKLEYICNNGHRGTITWNSWTKGRRCNTCGYERVSSKLRSSFSEIVASFSKEGYTVLSEPYEYKNNKGYIEFVCPNGHSGRIKVNNWKSGHRCTSCSHIVSKQETEIAEFLADKLDIIRHDRTIIPPFELDIVVPSKKMAIEYCGLYWHTEGMGKDKNYHLNKLNLCEDAGYRLITIFEDEWKYKKDIVKSRLKHILGISDCERVFARKCKIREIDNKTKNEFLERNHLLGKDVSSVRLGAFYGDRLVSVMTFSRGSVAKNNINPDSYELVRFCSDIDLHVVGIASKLLKYFKKNYFDGKIFSYSDKRWSDGGLYKSLGFEKYGDVSPNYWYVVGDTRSHRFNFRKSALKEKLNAFNDVLTEYENMFLNGFDRVWDCGNVKWA